jgi:hypothetical protein
MYDNRIGRCPRNQFAECAYPGSVVSTYLSNATGASAPWRFCFYCRRLRLRDGHG